METIVQTTAVQCEDDCGSEYSYYSSDADPAQYETEDPYANTPRCVQALFEAFKHFVDEVFYGGEQDDSGDERVDDSDRTTLQDIATVDELNAQLAKIEDETEQLITEIKWYMEKFPEDVVLSGVVPKGARDAASSCPCDDASGKA